MEGTMDVMRAALRVLTALNDRHDPDSADVNALKAYVPLLSNAPLDELACEAIQNALVRRAEIRSEAARG
jgi:hypothetical protein